MSERAIIEAAWSAVISTVAKGDASGAATAVTGAVAVGLLQAAGAAALLAVHHGVAGSDASTASLIAALRERDWIGDPELIELLTAAATGTGTGRGRLEVDLDGLGDVLGDQRGGCLDLTTGTAWPLELIELGQVDDLDPDDDPDDDPDRWLDIPGEGSRDAWRDIADFTRELTDPRTRAALEAALDGKGAFRRFQAALDRHETHRVHWRVFSTERLTGRARAWLARQGYAAVP